MNRPQEWVYITDQRNIPLREGRAVNIDGERVAIFNLGYRVLAVDDRCPHRGGPLSDGILTGDTIVCPLHYWKVCLRSGGVKPPGEADACVKAHAVRVEDGRIYLERNGLERNGPGRSTAGDVMACTAAGAPLLMGEGAN